MRIDILTIFPGVFQAPLGAGVLGKAIEAGSLEVVVSDIRDFADDPHRSVDDAPFGGGPGMVMKCGPLFAAVESLEERNSLRRVILLSPKGRRLTQDIVKELAAAPDMVLICGRYEGVDERVGQALCTDELSLGDYVLSGGEFAALVVVDAVGRMLPGVVGDWESVETDSFYHGILGPPQYTRPASFRGIQVPEVLRQGNHEAIRRYRRKEALRATLRQRPELMAKADKSKEDEELLQEIEREEPGRA